MKTETITVIIPCFNEEEALPVYYQAMQPVMKQMENIDFELLVIDDGSTDHTLLEMKALHQKILAANTFLFPVILEKKQPFMPVFPMPAEIMLQSWM